MIGLRFCSAGDAFRDPTNGLYCDHFAFDGPDPEASQAAARSGAAVCSGKQYSSAACGMGLVATCAFAEMGLLSHAEAEQRTLQTLTSLVTLWPRESFSGYFVHFCDAAEPKFRPTSEYSTVDTAEMAMGALFAGNYFGGDVQRAAQKIASEVDWSTAIKSATSPTIYPTVNAVSEPVVPDLAPGLLDPHCTALPSPPGIIWKQQSFVLALDLRTWAILRYIFLRRVRVCCARRALEFLAATSALTTSTTLSLTLPS